MKTYTFNVVLEKDKWSDEPEDKAIWRAYIPILEHQGAASWGYTQKDTIKNLQDAVDLLIESIIESGKIDLYSLIQDPENDAQYLQSQIQVSDIPMITVAV